MSSHARGRFIGRGWLLLAGLLLTGCGAGSLSWAPPGDPAPPTDSQQSEYVQSVNHYTLNSEAVRLIRSLGKPGTVGVRMPMYWKDVEPEKGVWQLEYNDPFVEASVENNIPILGLLGYSTGWSSTAPTDFDFTEIAPFLITWQTNSGALAWHSDSSQGAVEYLNNATLEDGLSYPRALYTRPPLTAGGFLSGRTTLTIPTGAAVTFRAKVGFLASSPAGSAATFSVSYSNRPQDPPQQLAGIRAWSDGHLDVLQADLTPFAGRTVQLTLRVDIADSFSVAPVWLEAKLWVDGSPATMRGIYGADSGPIIYYPPRDFDEFAEYVRRVVARHPEVEYWEVWNEPNLAYFWRPYPDAGGYLEMLRKSYAAVKEANPGAQVVLGGLSSREDIGWRDVIIPKDFLQSLYDAGGKQFFDILGVHPYRRAEPDTYLESELSGLKSFMEYNGDADKKIWITEIGWYTGTAGGAMSEDGQARCVREMKQVMAGTPYLERVYWYELQDACGQAGDPECNYGLFRFDGTPKAAALGW